MSKILYYNACIVENEQSADVKNLMNGNGHFQWLKGNKNIREIVQRKNKSKETSIKLLSARQNKLRNLLDCHFDGKNFELKTHFMAGPQNGYIAKTQPSRLEWTPLEIIFSYSHISSSFGIYMLNVLGEMRIDVEEKNMKFFNFILFALVSQFFFLILKLI